MNNIESIVRKYGRYFLQTLLLKLQIFKH